MSESMTRCVQTCLGLPGRTIQIEPLQRVFHRGDRVETLFIVLVGEVLLVRATSEGDELVLQRTQAQQIVADASLVSDTYHCDAYAYQPATLYCVAVSDVLRHMALDANFALAWVTTLSNELKAARSQAGILRLKSVSKRLNAWCSLNGGDLPLKGKQIEVAREIGVTPEALYRELAKLRSSN